MVMPRQSLVVKILKHVPDRLDDRQPILQVARRFENRVEILDEIANLRAGAKVTPDHASAMFLEDAAVAVTARQSLGDLCGVGAAGAGQQKRLGDAGDVHRHHDLIGELRDLAASGRPNIAGTPHRLENPRRFGAVEIRFLLSFLFISSGPPMGSLTLLSASFLLR